MALLANLLPGVRELRPPLAAGSMWLLCLWLAIAPQIQWAIAADGTLWQSLWTLREAVSPVVFGAAVAFVAYLVGALSEAGREAAASLMRRLVRWDRRRRLARYRTAHKGKKFVSTLETIGWEPSDVEQLLEWRESVEQVLEDAGRAMRLSETGYRSVNQVARATVGRVSDAAGGADGMVAAMQFIDLELDALKGRPAPNLVGSQGEADFLREVILREGEATRTRLLVKNAELFSKIDRLRSEADLRSALVLPVAAVGVVIVGRAAQGPIAIWVFLGLLLASFGLYLDAKHKRRASDDALAEALAIGEVETPTISRLRAVAEDEVERERFHRWRERRPGPNGERQRTDGDSHGSEIVEDATAGDRGA